MRELGVVYEASRVSQQDIAEEIKSLADGLEMVREELVLHENRPSADAIDGDRFHSVMTKFLQSAKLDFAQLEASNHEMNIQVLSYSGSSTTFPSIDSIVIHIILRLVCSLCQVFCRRRVVVVSGRAVRCNQPVPNPIRKCPKPYLQGTGANRDATATNTYKDFILKKKTYVPPINT